jgi:hypothetical protein
VLIAEEDHAVIIGGPLDRSKRLVVGPAALLRIAGAEFRPDGANGGGRRPAG